MPSHLLIESFAEKMQESVTIKNPAEYKHWLNGGRSGLEITPQILVSSSNSIRLSGHGISKEDKAATSKQRGGLANIDHSYLLDIKVSQTRKRGKHIEIYDHHDNQHGV